jgi:hypothetical protein
MIHAFKQIRLNGSNVLVTGAGVLQVGSESVVYQSQTGVLAPQSRLDATGSYLLSQISANSAGVSQLNSLSGSLIVSGYGNISVTTSGQVIRVSGDTGAYAAFATAANLALTGANIAAWTGTTPSIFAQKTETGTFIVQGQTGQFASSINLFTTGSTLDTKINNASGYANNTFVRLVNQQNFVTGIPTGIDNYFISFPSGNFPAVPKIQATVEVTGNIMYMMNVSNRTVSGYTAIFSDTIQESGVSVHTFASIG